MRYAGIPGALQARPSCEEQAQVLSTDRADAELTGKGITGLSIGAAFIIGTIEILGILTTEAHLHGGFWSVMANFNINVAGFCIAALFVAVWAAALA